jgi:hypothetical protein
MNASTHHTSSGSSNEKRLEAGVPLGLSIFMFRIILKADLDEITGAEKGQGAKWK